MTINKQKTTEAVDFEQVDINPTPTFTVDQCEYKPGSFTFFEKDADPFTKERKSTQWSDTKLVCQNVYIRDAKRDIDAGLINIQVTTEADPTKEEGVPVATYTLSVASFTSLEKSLEENPETSDHPLVVALEANVELYDSGKGVLVNLHRFVPFRTYTPRGNWFGKITLANGSVDTPADKKLAGLR